MDVLIDGAIVLHGTVGARDGGFSSRDVREALARVAPDRPVTVRINSGGGDAFDGVAIYNALEGHAARIRVEVEGLAASAASVIAMAGDDIVMRRGALMMVHEPWVRDEKSPGWLDQLADNMASIYAKRTGKAKADIRLAMKAETWMDGAEAVAEGFATATDDQQAEPWARFEYSRYRNMPATTGANARAERRAAAILNHPDAKGREALAAHLAHKTALPFLSAAALLRASGRSHAAPPADVWKRAIADHNRSNGFTDN